VDPWAHWHGWPTRRRTPSPIACRGAICPPIRSALRTLPCWLTVVVRLIAAETPTKSITPKRKRSTEPQAFEGLTHKPHCALCEQETGETAPAPPLRPDPMPPTNRRPRTVDTSMHFCPHPECDYGGWLGLHNRRANGHPGGGPWRQFHCVGGNGYCPEHHGTLVHGQQAAAASCKFASAPGGA
jgi:hypothetical protein